MSALIGRVFRSYEILQELGRGGMAIVYLAHQQNMDRLVAIKVISAAYSQEPDFRARFDQEARIIARLEHPHILPVIDYGEEDFGAYLVMRYVGAGTLETRLAAGPLPLPAARNMFSRIASALAYAHAKGVIHRDLKPGNILLDEADNPYLTDFGIARILQSATHLTRTGAAVGTPAYMAPEQWKAEPIGPYTDQYALGVLLYQMVTGVPPFDAGTTYGFMHKHIYEAPPPPRTILEALPPAAETVILRALAKEPGERFPSVQAMSEALEAAVPATPTGELAAVPWPKVSTTPTPSPAGNVLPTGQEVEQTAPAARRDGGGRGLIALTAIVTVALLLIAALLLGGGVGLFGTEGSPTMAAIVGLAGTSAGDSDIVEQTATPSPTSTATATPTATPTPSPDVYATADALDLATFHRLVRHLTATARAVVVDLATSQAAQTATASAMPSTTPTQTPPPSQTPVASPTAPLRVTAPPTPTLTSVATVTLASCAGLLPSRLTTGQIGIVSDDDPRPVNVRAEPGLEAVRLGQFPVNTQFRVVEGPICLDGYPWFMVQRLSDGLTGWIAESGQDAYFVEPLITAPGEGRCPGVLASRLHVGATALVDTPDGLPLRLHSDPGSNAPVTASIANRVRVTLLDGLVCLEGYGWWKVRAATGHIGWTAEADADSYFLAPAP
ncbi:MAG: protein kinase [Anaerolineae bacterium]|nr:protein kinase [Anaerolineae bacterium]